MTTSSEKCSSCDADLPNEAKFCVSCGIPLAAAGASASAVHTVSGIRTEPIDDEEDEQSKTASPALKPGDVVAGKFEIERIVGQGGMGVVYKAKELVSGQTAALKVIGAKFVGSDKAVQRLIDEGTTTRGISHPNVVQIYDIGLHGTQPYIAMEFIDGKPLHIWRGEKMANGKPVPIQVVGQIIKQILNGLGAAHRAGVIHRDLKPENIMLLDEPTATTARVKIVDFGIALATKTATASGTGTGLGTQLYMAPEQIRNANAANASADLYSLSKIFYELIVGVLPTGHWQPPSGGRADVMPEIDALIETGLSANRDMRPQSAGEYKAKLLRALDSRKPVRSFGLNKTALKIGGGVIAALILIGALFSETDTEILPDPEIPESRSFAYYNGTWADPFGGSYRIRVSNNGELRGSGRLGDGSNVTIAGEMDRQNLIFSLGVNGQVYAEGTGVRTDQCHFNFRMENYAVGQSVSGVFHVNHQPGEDCP